MEKNKMQTKEHIECGIKICNENPFYKTLSILLKYFFLNTSTDSSIISDLIKDVTKSETEFQVFMIYKNYALDLFYKYKYSPVTYKDRFLNLSNDDIVHYLISVVKSNYDKDHTVIKPYIVSIEENKDETIQKYHYIKSTYMIKNENYEMMTVIEKVISLLEQSKEYEYKAIQCRENAMIMLQKMHGKYKEKDDNLKLLKM